MSANTLIAVKKLGQRIWLDNLSRTLLQEGELARLIERDGIAGVTSNPAIFYKAIDDGKYYADDYQRLKATVNEPETRYEGLVIPDIQAACDLLLSQYQATFGADGYVSLEVSPFLARFLRSFSFSLRASSAMARRRCLLILFTMRRVSVLGTSFPSVSVAR